MQPYPTGTQMPQLEKPPVPTQVTFFKGTVE